MINNSESLEYYLYERIIFPKCKEETKSYILNVFATPVKHDLSKDSLTLKYYQALSDHKFQSFQHLADWILFVRSIFPATLNGASPEYYDALAQSSYYQCYKLMQRRWILFEELADIFPVIIESLQDSLKSRESSHLTDTLPTDLYLGKP